MLKLKNISRVNCKRSEFDAGFLKIPKRDFFLKYLEQKGIFDLNSSKKSANIRKIESINLKDMLNEKNISVTIFDILTDYRNFRKEYYTFASEKIQHDTTKLPFERKETNLKNIIYYYLFSVIKL
jgi:UDP-glucose 6-dehydrogenase